jgi:hypothetical protein
MRPLIPDGSVCVITASADVRPGDVIACARGETLVIHRLIAVTPGTFITRGDATVKVDPPWRRDEVLGRIDEVHRPGGRLLALGGFVMRRLGRVIALLQRVRSPLTGSDFDH